METVFLMTESHDHNQPMEDKPQVETGSVVGPPPSNPPPPPPGGGAVHADDVAEDWASGDNSNNANANQANSETDDDASSQASDDADSEVSEDAISVLAQVAVEEVMEVAVKQASDDNQDSINANLTVSCGEQELTTMAAGGLPQRYHYDSDSDNSEEDGRGWRFEQNSPPPSLNRPACSTNKMQPPNDSDDDDEEESESLQEVTTEAKTWLPPQ